MFQWKDQFTCNVSEFDQQHKKLFELAYNLYSIVSERSDEDNYDEIMEALSELQQYTLDHFKAEEALMEKYAYPKLMSHKMQHKKFIFELQQLLSKDVDENQAKISLEILRFVSDWIEDHILKTDHLYGAFLNEKGIS